jgi:resuscitation-promoting factor RpfB
MTKRTERLRVVSVTVAAASAERQVTTKTVTETKPIGYSTRTVKDASLAKGVKKTRPTGASGIRTLTYRIASDVDCAGGSGPAYVSGTVRVIGTDIYHLDRDGDGVACDT